MIRYFFIQSKLLMNMNEFFHYYLQYIIETWFGLVLQCKGDNGFMIIWEGTHGLIPYFIKTKAKSCHITSRYLYFEHLSTKV
jgi:hypothetical protein